MNLPIFLDANRSLLALLLVAIVLHALHVVITTLILVVIIVVLLLVLLVVVLVARTAGTSSGDDGLLLGIILDRCGGRFRLCLHWSGFGLGIVAIVAGKGGVRWVTSVESAAASLTDQRRDRRRLLRRPCWARRGGRCCY